MRMHETIKLIEDNVENLKARRELILEARKHHRFERFFAHVLEITYEIADDEAFRKVIDLAINEHLKDA